MGMTLTLFARMGGRLLPGLQAVLPEGLRLSREERQAVIADYRRAAAEAEANEAFDVPSEGNALLVLVWEVFR